MNAITNPENSIFDIDWSDKNLETLTIMSTVVLVYVINFIQEQIPQVSNMVMSAFNLKPENKLSEQLANDAETLTKAAFNVVKNVGQTVLSGGEKTSDKKEDKKEDKKDDKK